MFGSVLCVLVLCAALVAGGVPTIVTDCGPVSGTEQSGVNVYLGIPYATPPVKSLRWQNSISLKQGNQCWSGTYNANEFGQACSQPPWGDDMTTGEDCLFLNVWAPNVTDPSKPLPVMFYIHGGGFNGGSGQMDGVPFIVDTNGSVILVSINYRLNAFGFLALKELSANSKTGTSGNYGITDMITALQWVQTNIAKFGGDPTSVTIFGQSSGGTGVLMLMISPLATGLFHKAILLSSSTRVEVDLEYAEDQNTIFVDRSNCSTSDDVLACIYALSTSEVVSSLPWNIFPYWGHAGDFDLPNITVGDSAMLGIVDGYIITMPVFDALASGQFSDVPVIFGTMAQEVDLGPPINMLNYTEAQYNAYINYRFAPWNNASLVQQIFEYYNIGNYMNLPQLAYDSLSSDIHATCGQSFLASIAGQYFNSPVYRYVATQWPSKPMCDNGYDGYCPRYAYHTWDLVALMDSYPSYFTKQASDQHFTDTLQTYFVQLAINGSLSAEWPTVDSQGGSHVVTNLLNYPNAVVPDYHGNECAALWEYGFYMYSWNS